jgi:phosphoglycolate phosphatase-like HAD superfamily hydrolase
VLGWLRPSDRALCVRERQTRLFGGIDTVLQSLSKDGLVLAAVSSNSEENVRRLLGPKLAKLLTTMPAVHLSSARPKSSEWC